MSFLASSLATVVAPYISIPAILLVASFANPVQGMVGLETADVTALTNYSGTFAKKLILNFVNGLDIADDVHVIRNLKGNHNLPMFTASSGIRPTNTNVTSRSGTQRTFSDRTISMKGGMKIFSIIPEELRETYMNEMLDPNAKEIPFAQWVWEGEFNQLKAEINDNCYLSEYNADAADWDSGTVYNSGDFVNFNEDIYEANTTTTAGDSPSTTPASWDIRNATSITTGLGTILANEITAANISPVTTGSITSSNAYDSVILVYRGLSQAVKNKGVDLRCYVSEDVFDSYLDQIETDFGTGNVEDLPENAGGWVTVRKTGGKLKIKACSWMGTSSRIIVAPKGNIHMGTNVLDDMNKIGKMVPTLHGYDAICKYLLGFQIGDLGAISVNEQA